MTDSHVLHLLDSYALDLLDPGAARACADHLHRCSACKREYAAIAEALTHVGAAAAAPPPRPLFARILDGLRAAGPLAPFLDRVADLFDLPAPDTRGLLDRFTGDDGWLYPFAGVDILPVQPGDRRPGAEAALLRVAAGGYFPRHRHVGEERLLILRGNCRQSDDTRLAPGDLQVSAAGSVHDFHIAPDCDLYAAVLAHGTRFEPDAH